MGQQKVKEEPMEEKKEEEKPKQEKSKKSKPARREVKKLKGKDWYVILAPKMFGESQIAETPAIDPKGLIGRTIEANVSEMLGQRDKYYMSLKFRVERVEDNKAYTQFHGYSTAKEHLFRIIRKRSQKVRAVSNVETKDGWKLQIVSLFVLNRNANIEIQRKARKIMVSGIEESARDSGIDAFIRSVTGGILQKEIRKTGNKVYPVRFSEIESIEVIKPGQAEAAAKGAGE